MDKNPAVQVNVLAGFFINRWRTMSKILVRFLISLVATCLILSCASAPPPKKDVVSPESQIKEAESSKQVKLMNERILMSSLSSKGDPYRDYKIGPEDLHRNLCLRGREVE